MKVGIIGCGKVAREAHLPSYRKLGLEIACVADPSMFALRRISAKRKYTDYKKMLKEPLDIVSICTPPFLHHEVCIEAAEQGINILVEKPLSLSVTEGMEIKKAAEKNNVKISVVHNYKYLPSLLKAKKMQETGQLGRLLSIQTFVHSISPPAWEGWKMDKSKSGSMILQWNHPLYINTWFAGKPKSVFAIGKKIIPEYPTLTDMRALIDFEECTGFIEMSQYCACPRISFRITGTGASLMMQPTSLKIMPPSSAIEAIEDVLFSLKNLVKTARMYVDMQLQPHMRYAWGSHYALIKEFVKSLENNCITSTHVDEDILSIKLADAIDDSIHSGERILI